MRRKCSLNFILKNNKDQQRWVKVFARNGLFERFFELPAKENGRPFSIFQYQKQLFDKILKVHASLFPFIFHHVKS